MNRIAILILTLLMYGVVWGQEVKYDLEATTGTSSKAIRFTSAPGDGALIYSENYGINLNRLVFETQDDGDQDYFVFKNRHWSDGLKDVFTIHRNYITSYAVLDICKTDLSASQTAFLKLLSPNSRSDLRFGLNVDYSWIQSYTGSLRINELGSDVIINLTGGNVGIGTNTPQTKLDVAGTLRASEIKVEANGQTADFVFDSSYNLRDLQEVEAFIRENKHLPEIPSAKEMEANGVNLAEMNKLLLQKIEELTLYTIELEKARGEESKERGVLEQQIENLVERLNKLENLILSR